LIQGTDGNFYGTTANGGTYNEGTVFQMTPVGRLTTLHSFCAPGAPSCTGGNYPNASLLQATTGEFYGTDTGGGYSSSNGTPAAYRVVSKSAIGATIPADAASGRIAVVAPKGMLLRNSRKTERAPRRQASLVPLWFGGAGSRPLRF
jgi:uncharacterized repeat protein (TIGR03803 family)